MTSWSEDELGAIAVSDDLHISPFRDDGVTYGTPTWIWSVAVDGDLYVRAYNGQASRWYQAALRQRRGRINVAGMTRDVSLDPVVGPVNDRIDDACSAKYRSSPRATPHFHKECARQLSSLRAAVHRRDKVRDIVGCTWIRH